MLSTMTKQRVDVRNRDRIQDLCDRVLDGASIDKEEALWLFELEEQADITDLMAAANRSGHQKPHSSALHCRAKAGGWRL